MLCHPAVSSSGSSEPPPSASAGITASFCLFEWLLALGCVELYHRITRFVPCEQLCSQFLKCPLSPWRFIGMHGHRRLMIPLPVGSRKRAGFPHHLRGISGHSGYHLLATVVSMAASAVCLKAQMCLQRDHAAVSKKWCENATILLTNVGLGIPCLKGSIVFDVILHHLYNCTQKQI